MPHKFWKGGAQRDRVLSLDTPTMAAPKKLEGMGSWKSLLHLDTQGSQLQIKNI